MFNFWNLVFTIFLLTSLTSLIFLKKPIHILFVSEMFWVVLITLVFVLASTFNDPRLLLIGVIFFFFAALELVLYFINYILKARMFKTLKHLLHIITTYANLFRYLKCLNLSNILAYLQLCQFTATIRYYCM